MQSTAGSPSRAVVVLGMHRSGTSALARCCNLLGAELGERVLAPKDDNEAGFWEDAEIVAADDAILAALGYLWHDARELPRDWAQRPEVQPALERLEAVVRREVRTHPLWVVKDPRLCLLLDAWLSLLERLGCAPLFLIAVRHPREVAGSLARRDGFSAAKSTLLWLRSALAAEAATRGRTRCFVCYDDLLADWRRALVERTAACGIAWPVSAETAAPAIERFLDRGLRHHDATAIETGPTTRAPLDRWAEAVHAALCSAATDPAFDPAPELERVRRELAAADAALGPLLAELQAEARDMRRTAEEHHASAVAAGQAHRVSELALQRSAEACALREEEIAVLSDRLAAEQARAAELDATLAQRSAELAEARLQLGAILASRSWRWTAALRRAAARLRPGVPGAAGGAPGARAERGALGRFLGLRRFSVDLAPMSGVERVGDRFRSAGSDPQLALQVRAARLPSRWAVLSFTGVGHGVLLRPRLYVDDGAGYSEATAIDLGEHVGGRFARLLRLPDRVAGLRLDPIEEPGEFELRDLRIDERGAAFVALELLRTRLRAIRTPAEARRFLRTAARAIARGRLDEVKGRLLAAREPDRSPESIVACGYEVPPPRDRYDAWLERNRWTDRAAEELRGRLAAAAAPLPKISVVMPVYEQPIDLLDRAIESVLEQVYPDFELCIADDASPSPAVRECLTRWAARDQRIRVVLRDANGGISEATNAAAAVATGELLAFVDADDEITPDALGEVALYAAAHPDTDVLYSDDDKIDLEGRRYAPQFKPDWSPELLLSFMYMSHLHVVRRALFAELGGFRAAFDGSQDYDFALRATERARHVGHLPLVLYHWRAVPGSTATSGGAKPASFDAGRRAVAEALARRGIEASVVQPEWAQQAKVGIFAMEPPDTGPGVAILIPSRNNHEVLRTCLRSLEKTTYRDFEVVVVDNASDDPETLRFLSTVRHPVLRVPNPGARFNFAAIMNRAAQAADAELLLFLNDDIEVEEPRWLSRMVGCARLPGVGAVGAHLFYPDGRTQHAGIVHGLYRGLAGPAFKLAPRWDLGYLSLAAVTRDCSAVTAACMLTPRRLFLELGGFDEVGFAVAYNDVDYGYRLVDRGLRCVYAAGAELVHHEGLSRGFADDPAEPAGFRRKYARRVDPWYNPNLSLDDERFRVQPRKLVRSAPRPIRALMCAFNLNREGAPQSQLDLTIALRERGAIDPIVFSPEDGPLRAAYEEAGIPVVTAPHPLRDVHTAEAYDEAIARFAAFAREQGAELVYGNTVQTFYAIDAARDAGLPSLWNPRESEPWQTYFNFHAPPVAMRALDCFRHPYRVIFVAEATREAWSALDTSHNFTVIPNGLKRETAERILGGLARDEARASLGIGPGEVALLLLGTVCERKGQHDLAHALRELPASVAARVRCFIVGDRPGDYSARLAQLVAALPAEVRARVAVVPETHEPGRYYRAADVFVCSSRIESYPRVILEAMAAGLPIVTTPVFGIREQVREGVNGLFYPPGQPAALARALAELVANDARRREMGEKSLVVLAGLTSFEQMVDAYAELFREAYASGGAPLVRRAASSTRALDAQEGAGPCAASPA